MDLKRGFVMATALFGGFVITCYSVLSMFVCCFRRFEGEKMLTDELYTINPEQRPEDKKEEVNFVVRNQRENPINSFEWIFCGCCFDARRQQTFEDMQAKLHRETDLAEMVQTLRLVKFMRSLNDDSAKLSDLVRYSTEYRVPVPAHSGDFPEKRNLAVEGDCALARTLTGKDSVQEAIIGDITGSKPEKLARQGI